jgi:glutathione synthase/RimK-type ligase-like ATP-grasp enzyme
MKILTCDSSLESAQLLRDTIHAITGKRFVVTKNPENIDGKFIRYGYSADVWVPDTRHNSASFIRLVCNKLRFSNLIAQHGFSTPNFRQDTRNVIFPCLIRHTLRSYDGRGIVVCRNKNDFKENWDAESFWTPFVRTTREYRVHVLGGKVAKIFAKVKPDDYEDEFPIRNLRLGYHYSLCDIDRLPGIQKLVKKLHPIIGGSFYTLDLGWDNNKKEYFVFEANSGSGLNEKTAILYAEYLIKELKIK